jgi:predicted transcriptional regulator
MQNPVILRAKQRVLFHILKMGRKYQANISQVARDMGLSDGNVNAYVHQLMDAGHLKMVRKGGAEYFKVTWKGQISLYPVILPRLLAYFEMVVGLTQILWAELSFLNRGWIPSPSLLLASGLIITGFAIILHWAENEMDDYLLESRMVSGEQKVVSTE